MNSLLFKVLNPSKIHKRRNRQIFFARNKLNNFLAPFVRTINKFHIFEKTLIN